MMQFLFLLSTLGHGCVYSSLCLLYHKVLIFTGSPLPTVILLLVLSEGREGGSEVQRREGKRTEKEERKERRVSEGGREGNKHAKASGTRIFPHCSSSVSLLFLLLCSFSFFFLRFHHRRTPERALYIFRFRYFSIFSISYQSFSLHVARMLQWPLPCRIQWSIFMLHDTWEIVHTAKQLSFLKILPHPTSDNILEINAV